jgi:uncharacterized membrane protein YhaH (DUF805 family)
MAFAIVIHSRFPDRLFRREDDIGAGRYFERANGDPGMILGVNPLIAVGVLASTAATDAAYVFFNAAVSGRRRFRAANWSAIWYLLSAFAVISYTENAIYVLFAATGSWLGAFVSVTWLRRESTEARHTPP